ncbi:MAG: hypothetical protein JO122_19310, partial [Acetobacteraceae bacterium]|nr:hypothetical protein [Acetobacteraceae bacterium]
RGKRYLSNAHGFLQAIAGGWQLSQIYRWNTGLPLGSPIDSAQWSTNWENQSEVSLVSPLPLSGCLTRNVTTPKFFGGCQTQAYQSFRSSYPGETGLRNYFRYPGYFDIDMGLGKSWKMPWSEQHQLQFRAEVFNLTNTQIFNSLTFGRTGWGIAATSNGAPGLPSPDFSNIDITSLQNSSTGANAYRVMQLGLRYSF